MARRSNVPKFGEWENESNVPYTAYFDNARKTRGNEKLNPNDPAHYRDLIAPRQPEKRGQDPALPNQGRPRPNVPEQRIPRDGTARRRSDDNSFDASPLHRNQNGRVGGAGGINKGSSHHQGSSGGHAAPPQNPGRARPKQPTRAVYDSDDYSSAVPKFGGWENNQESGEGYTEKFNKFINEKKVGGAVAPSPAGHAHKYGANKIPKKKKCFCFPWI